MAKYNLENYLETDGLGFPLNFRRGNPNPLDNSSVWKSLELAKEYAKNDPTAYVGQIISVVNYTSSTDSTVNVYYIEDELGTLKPVGSSSVGDESTITINENGTVSLYGIEGLELTRTEESGEVVSISYQPLYVNGKLIWVEPSSTTAEGLSTEIEGLKSRVSNLEAVVGEVPENKTLVEMIDEVAYDDESIVNRITAIENDYLDSSDKTELQNAINLKANQSDLDDTNNTVSAHTTAISNLTERIESVENDIDVLNGNDTVVGSVDYKIKEGINEFATQISDNGIHDTFKELVDYINEYGGDAAEMASAISTLEGEMEVVQTDIANAKTNISNNTTAISELAALIGEDSVDDQIKAAFEAANLDQYATNSDLTALTNRVVAIENDYLDSSDKTELADLISANSAKLASIETAYKAADEAINAALANKADSSSLNSAIDRIAALEEAGAEKNVIASVDEAQFSVDENRKLTLLDIAIEKVTGLSDALANKVDVKEGSRLLTSDEAIKLEKLVIGENGEVEVSGKVAAGNIDGLEDWITNRASTLKGLSENNFTNALLEKLNGIESGAKDNVIEAIAINDVPLAVSDKTVNIPIAAAENFGVVKSSDEDNKISVNDDGTMEVNGLNVNRLIQTDGDSLILNGGSSAV